MRLKKKSYTEGFWTIPHLRHDDCVFLCNSFCLSFSSFISFLPGGTELYKQLSLLTLCLKMLIAQSHNSSIHLLNLATVNWAGCQMDRMTDGFWLKLLSNFGFCFGLWSFYVPRSPSSVYGKAPSLVNKPIHSVQRAWMLRVNACVCGQMSDFIIVFSELSL